jgi:hypothetical protein
MLCRRRRSRSPSLVFWRVCRRPSPRPRPEERRRRVSKDAQDGPKRGAATGSNRPRGKSPKSAPFSVFVCGAFERQPRGRICDGLRTVRASNRCLRPRLGRCYRLAFAAFVQRVGGVAERLKAHAWKVCMRETVSRVRIPPPPPLDMSKILIIMDCFPERALFALTFAPTGAKAMARTDEARASTLSATWRLARIGLADDPDNLLDRVGASPPISRTVGR